MVSNKEYNAIVEQLNLEKTKSNDYFASFDRTRLELKEAKAEIKSLKDKIVELECRNVGLKKSCEELASKISASVTDCKVGPWCSNCKYYVKKQLNNYYTPLTSDGYWFNANCATDGYVEYCDKHITEICPEFERNEG